MAQAVEAVVVVKVHLRVDGKVGSSKWLAHIGRVGEISHARDGISPFWGIVGCLWNGYKAASANLFGLGVAVYHLTLPVHHPLHSSHIY